MSGQVDRLVPDCPSPRRGDRRVPLFVAACALLVLMLAFFVLFDPHRATGTSLIPDGAFERSAAGWTSRGRADRVEGVGYGGGHGVRLAGGAAPSARFFVSLPVPDGQKRIRFSARMRTENVERGDHAWDLARLVVVFRDASGAAHWEDPSTAGAAVGTTPWRSYVRVFDVPPYAVTVDVLLDNSGIAGSAFIDDVLFEPVEWQPLFRAARPVFAGAWMLLFALNVGALRLLRTKTGRWIAACAVSITLGVLAPADSYRQILTWTAERIARVGSPADPASPAPGSPRPAPAASATPLPPAGSPAIPSAAQQRPSGAARQASLDRERQGELIGWVKAAGHAVLFAALGIFVGLAFQWGKPFVVGAVPYLLIFPAATEILQFTVARRQPRFSDLGIDLAAEAVGVMLGWLIARWRTIHAKEDRGVA